MTATTPKQETDDQENVIIVDWDGPNDPDNPKNWPTRKKWTAAIMVSLFTLISPVSSSMVAPAAEKVAEEFNITSSTLIAMITSIFVLAYAVGPLLIAPLSEIFGRTRVLQLSNLFYFVWNLACGFSQNKAELIVFRFLAGLGGSAPQSVGGGTLADIFKPEERGKAIAIYTLAPLFGPILGPIAGAWIAEKTTWRWVFWSTSIATILVQIAGLFFLQESYAPVLLERKAAKMRKTLDNEKGMKEVRTIYSGEQRGWQNIFSKALIRPFVLFAVEPIIQVIGIYMAVVYGIYYLFLTTMPSIFGGVYHESNGIAGLHYLALGIGMMLSSQLNARYMDRIYIYFKEKNNGVGQPEFRVPAMFPGSILLPIGILLSGWSAEKALPWIVTDIGIALVAAGIILTLQAMQTFVVDAFTLHAASALASVACLRSLAGFGFPLFAPKMFNALGYGKGGTVLAVLSIVLGVPAPFLFWSYGAQIRGRSRNARK